MKNFHNNKGVTLTEVIMAALLLTVVFLAVSALFVTSQTFHFTSNDKVAIGYELQYAIGHIYKNVMSGIGDKGNPAIAITDDLEFVVRHIEETDPENSPTYSDYTDDEEITYTITGDGKLSYVNSVTLEEDTDMIPRVTLLTTNDPVSGERFSKFELDGGVLRIKLTAESLLIRGDNEKERLTIYSACYPRLASFQ
ncbi:hypothetical protein ACFL28_00940 [Candidatus Omnitrophota bacterium]